MGEITINSKKLPAILAGLILIFNSFCFAQTAESSSGSAGTAESTLDETSVSLNVASNPEEGIALDFNNDSSGDGSVWVFVRMVLVLAIVVAAMYFLFKFFKKKTMPQAQSDDPFMRNVSSISLGMGKSVQVVTLLDKAYMLGVSENSVNLIDKIDDKELIDAMNLYCDKHTAVSKPKTFTEILEIFMPPKKNRENSGSAYDSSTEEILDQLKNRKNSDEDQA